MYSVGWGSPVSGTFGPLGDISFPLLFILSM